ncbi:MAG: hypothetical protein AB7I50_07530 [Vicinamibacterales bacterium]
MNVCAFIGWRPRVALGLATLVTLPLVASCASDTVRQGRGGSYLIIDALEGASGALECDEFGTSVPSDVITYVKKKLSGGDEIEVPTIFEDCGRVRARLALKNIGSATSPTEPTANNFITITRYRVLYKRADGRNTPGVDVPYPFDGGMTLTVGDQPATAGFLLVRAQAKEEAPLIAIARGGGAIGITTIAEITFYGADQAGNDVTATGSLTINFSNYGDPD